MEQSFHKKKRQIFIEHRNETSICFNVAAILCVQHMRKIICGILRSFKKVPGEEHEQNNISFEWTCKEEMCYLY